MFWVQKVDSVQPPVAQQWSNVHVTKDLTHLVVIRSFPTESEAHLAVSYLKSEGIEAAISHIDPWPSPILGQAEGVHVIGAAGDAKGAGELLETADLKNQTTSNAEYPNDVQVLVNGIIEEISRALKTIRHRRRLYKILLFGCSVPFFFLSLAITRSEQAAMALTLGWTLLSTIPVVLNYLTECPRCGERFHKGPYYQSPWTQKCLHCKLSLRADQGGDE